MAASFDAVNGHVFQQTSPVTWTHTPVGTPTLVLVLVGMDGGTLPTIGAVTYGGQTTTFVGGQTTPNGQNRTELYRLTSPPAGAQTVSVSWSGGTGNPEVSGASETFLGSDTGTPLGTLFTASGTTTPATADVTDGTANDVIADGVVCDRVVTVGGGQTQRFNHVANAAHAGSTEPGAATVTMSWTTGITNPTQWGLLAVAVKATAAAGQKASPALVGSLAGWW